MILLLPLSLMVWAFSKERNEDEYIDEVRLEAMQIAIYANYSILLISIFSFYNGDFWSVMNINMLTITVIFIGWFQYKLYRINKLSEAKNITS